MVSTPTESATAEGHPVGRSPLPEFVDWLFGAIIALSGLFLVVGGSALVFLVDRTLLAEGVEDGTITVTVGTTELTDAETLTVADAVVSWTGPGLLLTGVGLVLFAVGYVVARHRAHRQAGTDDPVSSYGTFAVLGAVTTVVLSFIPVSPAVGGALAGYLERGESDRTVSVGTLAGLLPMLPVIAILLFVFGGLVTGLLAIEQAGNAIVVGTVVLLSVLLVATVGAGLGALGGYVGGRLADRRATVN
ncbi:DUF5518 domain-containing protein [Natronorubrum thiooxidans]|uniref:Uncharacterized protein n=1 Tax=Natronorubrum thiooxidans TaxID=308853 RepID=A0A1N7CNT5_9EURY|nr:DUF5518 domain-containing protein [Natronorubrum thiooxidans]SIR65279.1 hypothetical protein SAMN05421752_101483 [Natronorubrum thiooxidans]